MLAHKHTHIRTEQLIRVDDVDIDVKILDLTTRVVGLCSNLQNCTKTFAVILQP